MKVVLLTTWSLGVFEVRVLVSLVMNGVKRVTSFSVVIAYALKCSFSFGERADGTSYFVPYRVFVAGRAGVYVPYLFFLRQLDACASEPREVAA